MRKNSPLDRSADAGSIADGLQLGARGLSFHDYVLNRRYYFGRGSKRGWRFVARALGDCHLPDARSWIELRTYLVRSGDGEDMVGSARIIWGSYLAEVAKRRRASTEAVPVFYADGTQPARLGR